MTELAQVTGNDLAAIDGHRILLNVDGRGVKPLEWAINNKQDIERLLMHRGALLIRGLKIHSSRQFASMLTEIFGEPLADYTFRSTPRTELRGNIYTATEYHSSETIPQHNENAYTNRWPMRIGFLSLAVADTGGATPLADSRAVYQKIPQEIRQKFEKKNVMYVRNYGEIDLPWSEVFQTDDRTLVEDYCRENDIKYEWYGENGLRTRQVVQACAEHPDTGEKLWFNQAHLFHYTNVGEQQAQDLLSNLGEAFLPRNTYYGDGSPFDPEDLKKIRQIYDEEKFSFTWEKHDLLLLDNMLYTHGREPFSGTRKVLVGMARAHTLQVSAEAYRNTGKEEVVHETCA